MIHKFVLGRCVQCNLSVDDLESAGWDCHGHGSGESRSNPAAGTSDQGGSNRRHEGDDELRIDIPQVATERRDTNCADLFDCPKCAAKVKTAAYVCPHCSFNIAGYRSNIVDGKHTEMTPVPVNSETKKHALTMVYSRSTGCAGWLMLIASGIVWIVPVVGWIAAPIFFIIGIITVLSPVTGAKWMDKTFGPEEYAERISESLQLLQNSFINVTCPNCKHIEKDVSWDSPGGFFDCPQCAKRSFRQESILYYIPFPEALVTDNLKELPSRFVGTRSRCSETEKNEEGKISMAKCFGHNEMELESDLPSCRDTTSEIPSGQVGDFLNPQAAKTANVTESFPQDCLDGTHSNHESVAPETLSTAPTANPATEERRDAFTMTKVLIGIVAVLLIVAAIYLNVGRQRALTVGESEVLATDEQHAVASKGDSKLGSLSKLVARNPYIGQTFRSEDNRSTVYFRTSSELEIANERETLACSYTIDNSNTVRAILSLNGTQKILYYRPDQDGIRREDSQFGRSVLLLSPEKYDEMLAQKIEKKRIDNEKIAQAHLEMRQQHISYIKWIMSFFAKGNLINGMYERSKMTINITTDPVVTESKVTYRADFIVSATIQWNETSTLREKPFPAGEIILKGSTYVDGESFSGKIELIRQKEQGNENLLGSASIRGGLFGRCDPFLTLRPEDEETAKELAAEEELARQREKKLEQERQMEHAEARKMALQKEEQEAVKYYNAQYEQGRTIDEVMFTWDWKYPEQVRAAIENVKREREEAEVRLYGDNPRQLQEYRSQLREAIERRDRNMREEVEYQKRRAANPDRYPDKHLHYFEPVDVAGWKRLQEFKKLNRSGVAPKASRVEP